MKKRIFEKKLEGQIESSCEFLDAHVTANIISQYKCRSENQPLHLQIELDVFPLKRVDDLPIKIVKC